MKYIIPFFASLMCLIMVSCSSDDLSDIEAGYDAELKSIGNPIKVSLSLKTSDFSSDNVSTRAEGDEEPITYIPDDYDEALMVKEKVINDLWVFEYDATSGSLIYDPQYVEVDEDSTEPITVELSDNSGEEVTLYFIANAAGANSAETWLNSIEASTYSTISSLEALNIPFTDAILLDFDETSGAYNTPNNFALPMSAKLSQVLPTDEEEIEEMEPIEVNLEFMVSKVMFGTSLDEESFDEFYDLSGTTIDDFDVLSSELYFVNAPTACYKVGALGSASTSPAVDYSKLNATWLAGQGDIDFKSTSDVTYQYVLYMPENFQGFNSVTGSTSKAQNAPASSYSDSSSKPWDTNVDTSDWDKDLDILGYMSSTDALCFQATFTIESDRINSDTGNYLYSSVVFPGGNEVDNFNVRRTCVYHVMFTLKFVMYTGSLTITAVNNENYFLNEATF